MSWRPKGWNPTRIVEEGNITDLFSHRYIVELGADAMLEALKSKSLGDNYTKYPYRIGSSDELTFCNEIDGKYGWLVFIPYKED